MVAGWRRTWRMRAGVGGGRGYGSLQTPALLVVLDVVRRGVGFFAVHGAIEFLARAIAQDVERDVVVELGGDVGLVKDRLPRADRQARPAIDALVGRDEDLVRERFARLLGPVETFDRANAHARGVNAVSAKASDNVGHGAFPLSKLNDPERCARWACSDALRL